MKNTRREFLKKSGMFAGALAAAPQIIKAETLGLDGGTSANSRINIAVLSTGNQSGASGTYFQDKRCQVTVLCDPNKQRIAEFKQRICKDFKGLETQDFREALIDKSVDAVHISTGDHWHVPMSLASARAGKHIYCEKPLGISIEQCLAAREITARHKRVFQYGTQNRSINPVRLGIQLALNGYIGDIRKAVVWAPEGESGASATPVLPVPSDFNYDLWLGPAKLEPFCQDRCLAPKEHQRKGIYHIRDYAIGFIAGWGAHPVDQFQWYADNCGLGLPASVTPVGGNLPTEGLFNTLTHWDVDCRYDNGFEMKFMDTRTFGEYVTKGAYTGISAGDPKGGHGSMFMGEKGWINVHRGGWSFSDDKIRQRANDAMKTVLNVSSNHQLNFIDAVSGTAKTVTNLDSAIKSDIICHLSDIAVRTGKEVKWDATKEAIIGNAEQIAMMKQPMRPQYDLSLKV